MNTDRRTILSLVATGRITVGEAERLLAAWSDTRETTWILLICLAFAYLAQVHLRELLVGLAQIIDAQLPQLAAALHHTLWPITDLFGRVL